MTQRRTISGRRPALVWLSILIVLILLVAVLIIILFIYPNYERQQQVEQHYQAGMAFQDVGDWGRAVEAFEKVIAIDANYNDARTRLSELKTKQQEVLATAQAKAAQATATAEARAEAIATTAAAEALAQLEATYQKCLGAINLGRWAEAQTACDQVLAVDPNYKDVQAKLADIEAKLAELRALTPTPMPPTYTPYPTYTPLPMPPTYTPYPTHTPVPMPSPTLQPTATPLPTATPISGLPIGATYSKDGIEITLNSLQWDPDYGGHAVFIAHYTLTNNTQNDLLVDILPDNSEIVSDTSVRWRVVIGWVENKSFPSKTLKAEETFAWSWIYRHTWNEPIPPDAKVILVRLSDVSRIDFVEWKWNIPR